MVENFYLYRFSGRSCIKCQKREVENDVLISYAANWTEYHSCRGGGYKPIDRLWSNQNIDFVGVDYYVPLTDSEEADLSIEKNIESLSSQTLWLKNNFYNLS